METKSPVRSGRLGPSARWVWAIFSTMVWPIKSCLRSSILFLIFGRLSRPAHPALKRWANIISSLQDCRGVALTHPFALTFPSPKDCLLPHIRFHHSHQLVHRANLLQVPDCVF